MKILHQIGDKKYGANFNTLKELADCIEPVSFDGVYLSVYRAWKNHREAFLDKNILFFVTGMCIGGDNTYEPSQPYSRFCNFEQVKEMAEDLQATIGYHTWSHIDIRKLTNPLEIERELIAPDYLKAYWASRDHQCEPKYPRLLAWPYGDFSEQAIGIAKVLGYTNAWSVKQGDDTNIFKRKRSHIGWG